MSHPRFTPVNIGYSPHSKFFQFFFDVATHPVQTVPRNESVHHPVSPLPHRNLAQLRGLQWVVRPLGLGANLPDPLHRLGIFRTPRGSSTRTGLPGRSMVRHPTNREIQNRKGITPCLAKSCPSPCNRCFSLPSACSPSGFLLSVNFESIPSHESKIHPLSLPIRRPRERLSYGLESRPWHRLP